MHLKLTRENCRFRFRLRATHARGSSGSGGRGGSVAPPSPGWSWRASDEATQASVAPGYVAHLAAPSGTSSSPFGAAPPPRASSSPRGRRRGGRSESHPRGQGTLGEVPQTRHGDGHHQKRPVSVNFVRSFQKLSSHILPSKLWNIRRILGILLFS